MLIGGAVHTTAVTTAAGLMILVRKIFKLGCQLANPSPVVEAADESGVALVASDVQELLLGDQGAEARQVRVGAVAHDPSNHAGELAPLTFGKWLAVAGDRHQERRRGSGDGVREDLFRFRPGDDLASGADDVRDPISPNADDVATTSHGRALEVSRPCVHCQAHYSK
ncbi:MAG: hypothetical protein E6I96_16595 [Chloroflexi bacterium]|nr:MAG: hypothetical protein E6I96_16595 [Chloroflexota bacterium]